MHLHYALLSALPELHVLTKQIPRVKRRLQPVAADDQPPFNDGGLDAARVLGIAQPHGEDAPQLRNFSAGAEVRQQGQRVGAEEERVRKMQDTPGPRTASSSLKQLQATSWCHT